MTSARASALRARLGSYVLPGLFLAVVVATGCATENKVLKTPRYTLAYPDFWKVDTVGTKDGEPTKVTIGKYSNTVINEGSGATSMYEASQADVDVRIFAWPAPADTSSPTIKVADSLVKDTDLNLVKQSRVPVQPAECGVDFKRKFTILKSEQETLDLASRPGFRVIVVGAIGDGSLVGVVARVPHEQDAGLYCHNLSNMRTQLQTLLDGLSTQPVAATPAGEPAPAAADAPKPTAGP